MALKIITVAIAAVVAMTVGRVDAQTYTYVYAGAGSGTYGSFAISGSRGAYTLGAFSGTVGGVSYSTNQVGLQATPTPNVYVGGLLNGVDTVYGSTNDFFEDPFTPGSPAFTSTILYSTTNGGYVNVPTAFALVTRPTYVYTFLGKDSGTSGSFIISGSRGTYSLDGFSGTVGGVSYSTNQVGLQATPTPNVYVGGLLNGVDTVYGSTNDFFEDPFTPGSPAFTSTILYSTTNGGYVNVSTTFTLVVAATPSAPETATWAMMLIGTGAIGGTLRRRRRMMSARFNA